ncbi:MAG: response regulator [Verrucomicrobiales bacterium]|nr:response regulator [Verrucomicrobiales bacterium]
MKIIPKFYATQFDRLADHPVVDAPGDTVKNCTILVIDDDPGVQRLIHQTLAPGATVLQELDGVSERVESLDFDNVDAVILDYKMPGEDGIDVLKRIRTKYSQLPILFMTGFGDLDIAKEAISLGANEYFPKPFDPNDLRAVVSKWLPGFEISGPADQAGRNDVDPLLQDISEIENFLTAKDQNGIEIRARVVRYNSRSIVVEAGLEREYSPGTPLSDTCITLGHRSMEVVTALVLNTTRLAGRQLVEITLPGVWQIENFKEGTDPQEVCEIIKSREKSPVPLYSRFDQGTRERQIIPEDYRATITEFEHILQDFYEDLQPFEKFRFQVANDERAELEQRMIEYAEGRFFPALTEAAYKFEIAAGRAEEEGILEEFTAFARRRIYPLMLCSPFASRVIAKPIGIPGDFGMLGRILDHPYEGHTLYSRMLNAWILSANPSAAYRHRINLLEDAINETVEKAEARGQRAKILSMASGVAYEVQRFVKNPVRNPEVDFELVDFSDRTLFEAKKQFTSCKKANDPSSVEIILRQGSVIDLAKQSRKQQSGEDEQYDLVYCAGLFDYLSGRMCSSIVSYLYGLTRKGGKVIVSNYTTNNSTRYFRGVLLAWSWIYRST